MTEETRKYLVHSADQDGNEWIVGADVWESADAIAKQWVSDGHIQVRIKDTTNGQTHTYP